ncbi:unnamed protein product [Closterium sp. Naga37s-1]|nr:unnamed protein product [Closterium sp. Naga37s-1]
MEAATLPSTAIVQRGRKVSGQIPVRGSNDPERILEIYVEQSHPGSTTWDNITLRIRGATKLLAQCKATTTCRSFLST